mmetsp:Transcript_954/g.2051  ORF Transcript_954/g.2051 Transcript_954/m.2051 type:complete len:116 (+) Transcript_954:237-584(+)
MSPQRVRPIEDPECRVRHVAGHLVVGPTSTIMLSLHTTGETLRIVVASAPGLSAHDPISADMRAWSTIVFDDTAAHIVDLRASTAMILIDIFEKCTLSPKMIQSGNIRGSTPFES